jgi:tRNA-dihydrouridine synthase B
MDFWDQLKKRNKPILALAPMAGITDSAFRQICKDYGADVVYSEMASVTALAYAPQKTLEMLVSNKKETPYIVQLFGSNPEHFSKAVRLLSNKKLLAKFKIKNLRTPDGFDINFGCPVKKVAKQGAGAVLMNNLPLAHKIIEATINNTNLPVSIKIRSQVGEVDAIKFIKYINDLDIKAIMIHGRTLNQGHSGPVDWKIIKEACKYYQGIILANGGVKDCQSANDLLIKTKANGLGIGQGALGRPWIFKQLSNMNNSLPNSKQVELRINDIKKSTIKHAKLVYKLKGKQGIKEMRKHLCWYVSGFPNASELRRELVKTDTLDDIERIFNF